MDILTHLQKLNNFNYNNFKTLYLNNYHIGYVHLSNHGIFKEFFKDKYSEEKNHCIISLNNMDFETITQAFNDYAYFLSQKNIIKLKNEFMSLIGYLDNAMTGKNNEYPLSNSQTLAKIDRNLLPMLGSKAFGIHINCYCKINNEIYMWIAKRSCVVLEPNLLDNMVAGAISYGYNPYLTAIKESQEEANIPQHISKQATLIKTLNYKMEYNKLGYNGLKNDVVHIFELQIPQDFIPVAQDKEVADFRLLNLLDLEKLMVANVGNFKYNSSVVILHYLLQNHNFMLLNANNVDLIKNEFELLSKYTI